MTNSNACKFQMIRASWLIDGKGGPPIRAGALLLGGKTIIQVGDQEQLRTPQGEQVKETSFSDCTILPGLVDAHTHLNMPGDGRSLIEVMAESDDILLLRSATNSRAALHKGVTSLRDNGGRRRTTFSLREAIKTGVQMGPRLNLCGWPITITGGHCWMMGGEADGVEKLREAVRQLIKHGADYIKIMATGGSTPNSFPYRPSYTNEELRAIVDEAHRFGKLTGAHCRCTAGIASALDAGVDMLIHCDFQEADGSWEFRPEIAERIAKAEIWVNPTLHVVRSIFLRERDRKMREGPSLEIEAALSEARGLWEGHRENFRRLREAGVKVVAGGDTGWGYVPFGDFAYELEALHGEGGLSPMEAIIAATHSAADALGVVDKVGTLEPNKEADVLVVAGNPIDNIMDLMNVKAVFKAGKRVY